MLRCVLTAPPSGFYLDLWPYISVLLLIIIIIKSGFVRINVFFPHCSTAISRICSNTYFLQPCSDFCTCPSSRSSPILAVGFHIVLDLQLPLLCTLQLSSRASVLPCDLFISSGFFKLNYSDVRKAPGHVIFG